ncbi:hypothetical protein A2419_01265 [Candidatus Adlerbacteria bacterium RIFOXYC1_FULL_48_26]|uniref:Uncharacterized protein n=1 Tax=Candidatus Adlerbacteria bacterium RIFOXYC1_FULL_48_26 TaxID=1797247 RepID=A0A1F4Y2K9_9BACT|nr:MAG: hypothetical protein A2419_01265 [Candidatus Adlerbacteria bacterium RIFOXYC1_FULL_48_26]OGC93983.1 MAG: hypothetical protein A2389_00670 [Candidatus Adlerbacteria bacterium RIFOXYB1_FULL_48_10]
MQLSVRVTAGARKDVVEEVSAKRLKISVKEKPEQGAANARVVVLVATHFGVPKSHVRIIRGHKTPSKIIEIKE